MRVSARGRSVVFLRHYIRLQYTSLGYSNLGCRSQLAGRASHGIAFFRGGSVAARKRQRAKAGRKPSLVSSRVAEAKREAATMYLGSALRRTSNGLPGSPNEAGRLMLPYLAFLRAGFALPLLSPGAR